MKHIMGAMALPVLLALWPGVPARAEESCWIEESTVLGRNYGYPGGTPAQPFTPAGRLELVMETDVFFKNLELLELDGGRERGNRDLEGRTYYGFILPARARYRAHERVTLEMGAVLAHDFGDEDALRSVDPLVRLVYEPLRDVFVTAGTIFPTHWMHDGLHDDANTLRETSEQGTQLRTDLRWLKSDTWVNWRIQEEENTAEQFDIASAAQLRLAGSALQLDGQLLWAHVGGQRNLSGRVEHNVGFLGGASWGFPHPFGIDALDEVRVGARYMHSRDETRHTALDQGDGYEVFAAAESRLSAASRMRLHGSYFKGEDFLARRGDPLYELDTYGQAGATALFSLPGGLSIEAGGVLQYTENRFNHMYQVYFAWGGARGIQHFGD